MNPLKSGNSEGEPVAFLQFFALAVLSGLAVFVMAHFALAREGLLPPPPYVATDCIDNKLDALARRDLSEVSFLAVGSSATLRNLDMSVFKTSLGVEPLNAAPCFLQVDQTAFLTDFLKPRMPELKTVLVVVLPRDFENCAAKDSAFFDARQANLIFDQRMPRWSPYITGFRPYYLARHAVDTRKGLSNVPSVIQGHQDGFGSEVFKAKRSWSPELRIDATCFSDLSRFEAGLSKSNIKLVVALAPTAATWRERVDPSNAQLRDWERKMRDSLSSSTIFIPDWPDAKSAKYFSDEMHLIHPYEVPFSEYICRSIKGKVEAT